MGQNGQTILNRQLMSVPNNMLAGARVQIAITLHSSSVTLARFKCSTVHSGRTLPLSQKVLVDSTGLGEVKYRMKKM